MDEMIPAVIRDNKYFMYPFYKIWFSGMDLKSLMEFKSKAHCMSEGEFRDLYSLIGDKHNKRESDLNDSSLKYIMDSLDRGSKSLLDAGCGNGYFIKKISRFGYDLHGCDLMSIQPENYKFTRTSIENLPFADKQFDIVVCNHTLEHVIHIDKAVSELKRVTKKQLIITVPCQRYFRYTLDLHLHFFPLKSMLEGLVNIQNHFCQKLDGDLVYIGYPH